MTKNYLERITSTFDKHSGDIAKLLSAIRAAIHEAKNGLEETWKWGPGFRKDGKLLIGLWGFRKHVSLVFYHGAHMSDKHKLFNEGFDNAHNRMIRFTEFKQFNKKKVTDYVKEAVKISSTVDKKENKSQMVVPAPLKNLLAKNKQAEKFFNDLSHTYKREYAQLISSAKTEATRDKRLVKVLAALKAKKKTLQ